MKRIVCRNMIKKMMVCMILIIFAVQVMMPVLVFAADKNFEKTYNQWIEEQGNEDECDNTTLGKQQRDQIVKRKEAINDATVKYIKDKIYKGLSDSEQRASNLLKERGNKIILKGNLKATQSGTNVNYTFKLVSFKDKEMTNDELATYGEGNDYSNPIGGDNCPGPDCNHYVEYKDLASVLNVKEEQLANADGGGFICNDLYWKESDGYKDQGTETLEYLKWIIVNYKTEMTYTLSGPNDGYSIKDRHIITDYNIQGKSKDDLKNEYQKAKEDKSSDSADVLGGILLSPIFYLINFIADAVVSNLQRIMTGDGSLLRA